MSTIGQLIKGAREAKKEPNGKSWSQEKLAEKVEKSKQTISGIETDKKPASLRLLVNLYEKLVEDDEEQRQNPLALWLLAWMERALQDEGLPPDVKDRTQRAIQEAVTRLIVPTGGLFPGRERTLDHFPYPSAPLTVVCGDRREPNPKTRGDILADSVSITDLSFLLKLGLSRDVVIRSDKLFVLMSQQDLKQEFGNTNLLIIGSPAVNFAARLINNYSVFRFNVPQTIRKKEEQIRTLEDPPDWDKELPSLKELKDQQNLKVFWQLAQHSDDTNIAASTEEKDQQAREELIRRLIRNANITPGMTIQRVAALARMVKGVLRPESVKEFMNYFRRPGLIDFSDATVHGTSQRLDNDFAVISLAPNPFADSPEFVCVMVAGIHGPGTAHALRVLAEYDFQGHPFGGIIEVEMDDVAGWFARFQNATWRWQTKPYTAEKLLTNLRLIQSELSEGRLGRFQNLTNNDFEGCIKFVEAILNLSTDNNGSNKND